MAPNLESLSHMLFELGHDGEQLPFLRAAWPGLMRHGAEFFAVGAHCMHYHGPLADGLGVGDEVRWPRNRTAHMPSGEKPRR
jgi:hypothetical protein